MDRVVKTFAAHIHSGDAEVDALQDALTVLDARVNAMLQQLHGMELRDAAAVKDNVVTLYGEDFLVRTCVYSRIVENRS